MAKASYDHISNALRDTAGCTKKRVTTQKQFVSFLNIFIYDAIAQERAYAKACITIEFHKA